MPAAVVDVDGTLVDTNYHHALAWFRAFRAERIVLPMWRLHRHVGMGGDKFVSAVAGDEVEERLGDRLRDAWEERFDELIGETELLAGARELIEDLKRRGHPVVLASSTLARWPTAGRRRTQSKPPSPTPTSSRQRSPRRARVMPC